MADTAYTTHGDNYISQVQLPGSDIVYQIHDPEAFHNIEDLNLAAALVFMGTKETEAQVLAITEAKKGEVWLVPSLGIEYVCTKTISTADTSAWEKMGNVHDAASSSHKHNVTVTGKNAASAVTGSVDVPTVTPNATKLSASATSTAQAPSVTKPTDKVLGQGTQFPVSGDVSTTKKYVVPSITSTVVAGNGTASAITAITPTSASFVNSVESETGAAITSVTPTPANAITAFGTPTTANAITGFGNHTTTSVITGFGAHTTAKAATALNTTSINNPTVSNVSIPNVTNKGSASTWSFTVSDGTLVIAGANGTAPTLGTAISASKVSTTATTVATSIKSTANAITALGTPTTASPITALGTPTTAKAITGLGTPTTKSFVSSINTGTSDFVTTVTPGTGTAVTGLGTPTTKTVLTGVKVSTQPTVSLNLADATATGAVQVVTAASKGNISVASDTTDIVDAVTNVTVGAPSINTTVTIASGTTGDVSVIGSVDVGTKVGSVSGTAAAQTWTQQSGTTSTPV